MESGHKHLHKLRKVCVAAHDFICFHDSSKLPETSVKLHTSFFWAGMSQRYRGNRRSFMAKLDLWSRSNFWWTTNCSTNECKRWFLSQDIFYVFSFEFLQQWQNCPKVLIQSLDPESWSRVLPQSPDPESWPRVLIQSPDPESWSRVLTQSPDPESWPRVLTQSPDPKSWPRVLTQSSVLLL